MTSYGPQDNAEFVDPDRTINYDVFCERCGHNLRYSTYVGSCNECGHHYNARPGVKKGIFNPLNLRFPILDIALAALCLSVAYLLIKSGIRDTVVWQLGWGTVFAIAGILYVRLSLKVMLYFIRFTRVLRRARKEDSD